MVKLGTNALVYSEVAGCLNEQLSLRHSLSDLPYTPWGRLLLIVYEYLSCIALLCHMRAVFGDPGTTKAYVPVCCISSLGFHSIKCVLSCGLTPHLGASAFLVEMSYNSFFFHRRKALQDLRPHKYVSPVVAAGSPLGLTTAESVNCTSQKITLEVFREQN